MMTDKILNEATKGVNKKELASELGFDVSYLYRQLNGGERNILDQIKPWLKAENGDTILQWLCNENEGYFVKRITRRGKNDHAVIAKLLKEFAEVMGSIADALLDGKISTKEYKTMRKEWQDVQSVMESFFDSIERGEYD